MFFVKSCFHIRFEIIFSVFSFSAGTSIDLTNNCVVFEVKESGSIEILETIDLTGADVPNQQPQQYEVVNDIMEEQLSCSICSELLVSAMTLNCSHTFCHYCILSWMQKSKHCPNCRAVIKSMIKSLVLDNFIQTMVESVSADQKQRRAELINTRTSKLITNTHFRLQFLKLFIKWNFLNFCFRIDSRITTRSDEETPIDSSWFQFQNYFSTRLKRIVWSLKL